MKNRMKPFSRIFILMAFCIILLGMASQASAFKVVRGDSVYPFSGIRIQLSDFTKMGTFYHAPTGINFTAWKMTLKVYEGSAQITCKESENDTTKDAVLLLNTYNDYRTSECTTKAGEKFTIYARWYDLGISGPDDSYPIWEIFSLKVPVQYPSPSTKTVNSAVFSAANKKITLSEFVNGPVERKVLCNGIDPKGYLLDFSNPQPLTVNFTQTYDVISNYYFGGMIAYRISLWGGTDSSQVLNNGILSEDYGLPLEFGDPPLHAGNTILKQVDLPKQLEFFRDSPNYHNLLQSYFSSAGKPGVNYYIVVGVIDPMLTSSSGADIIEKYRGCLIPIAVNAGAPEAKPPEAQAQAHQVTIVGISPAEYVFDPSNPSSFSVTLSANFNLNSVGYTDKPPEGGLYSVYLWKGNDPSLEKSNELLFNYKYMHNLQPAGEPFTFELDFVGKSGLVNLLADKPGDGYYIRAEAHNLGETSGHYSEFYPLKVKGAQTVQAPEATQPAAQAQVQTREVKIDYIGLVQSPGTFVLDPRKYNVQNDFYSYPIPVTFTPGFDVKQFTISLWKGNDPSKVKTNRAILNYETKSGLNAKSRIPYPLLAGEKSSVDADFSYYFNWVGDQGMNPIASFSSLPEQGYYIAVEATDSPDAPIPAGENLGGTGWVRSQFVPINLLAPFKFFENLEAAKPAGAQEQAGATPAEATGFILKKGGDSVYPFTDIRIDYSDFKYLSETTTPDPDYPSDITKELPAYEARLKVYERSGAGAWDQIVCKEFADDTGTNKDAVFEPNPYLSNAKVTCYASAGTFEISMPWIRPHYSNDQYRINGTYYPSILELGFFLNVPVKYPGQTTKKVEAEQRLALSEFMNGSGANPAEPGAQAGAEPEKAVKIAIDQAYVFNPSNPAKLTVGFTPTFNVGYYEIGFVRGGRFEGIISRNANIPKNSKFSRAIAPGELSAAKLNLSSVRGEDYYVQVRVAEMPDPQQGYDLIKSEQVKLTVPMLGTSGPSSAEGFALERGESAFPFKDLLVTLADFSNGPIQSSARLKVLEYDEEQGNFISAMGISCFENQNDEDPAAVFSFGANKLIGAYGISECTLGNNKFSIKVSSAGISNEKVIFTVLVGGKELKSPYDGTLEQYIESKPLQKETEPAAGTPPAKSIAIKLDPQDYEFDLSNPLAENGPSIIFTPNFAINQYSILLWKGLPDYSKTGNSKYVPVYQDAKRVGIGESAEIKVNLGQYLCSLADLPGDKYYLVVESAEPGAPGFFSEPYELKVKAEASQPEPAKPSGATPPPSACPSKGPAEPQASEAQPPATGNVVEITRVLDSSGSDYEFDPSNPQGFTVYFSPNFSGARYNISLLKGKDGTAVPLASNNAQLAADSEFSHKITANNLMAAGNAISGLAGQPGDYALQVSVAESVYSDSTFGTPPVSWFHSRAFALKAAGAPPAAKTDASTPPTSSIGGFKLSNNEPVAFPFRDIKIEFVSSSALLADSKARLKVSEGSETGGWNQISCEPSDEAGNAVLSFDWLSGAYSGVSDFFFGRKENEHSTSSTIDCKASEGNFSIFNERSEILNDEVTFRVRVQDIRDNTVLITEHTERTLAQAIGRPFGPQYQPEEAQPKAEEAQPKAGEESVKIDEIDMRNVIPLPAEGYDESDFLNNPRPFATTSNELVNDPLAFTVIFTPTINASQYQIELWKGDFADKQQVAVLVNEGTKLGANQPFSRPIAASELNQVPAQALTLTGKPSNYYIKVSVLTADTNPHWVDSRYFDFKIPRAGEPTPPQAEAAKSPQAAAGAQPQANGNNVVLLGIDPEGYKFEPGNPGIFTVNFIPSFKSEQYTIDIWKGNDLDKKATNSRILASGKVGIIGFTGAAGTEFSHTVTRADLDAAKSKISLLEKLPGDKYYVRVEVTDVPSKPKQADWVNSNFVPLDGSLFGSPDLHAPPASPSEAETQAGTEATGPKPGEEAAKTEAAGKTPEGTAKAGAAAESLTVSMDSIAPNTGIDPSKFTGLEVAFTPHYNIEQYTVEIWQWAGDKLVGERRQVASCKSGTDCSELVKGAGNYKKDNKMVVKINASNSDFKKAVEAIKSELEKSPNNNYCVRVEATDYKKLPTPPNNKNWADTACTDITFLGQQGAAAENVKCTSALECLAYIDAHKFSQVFKEAEATASQEAASGAATAPNGAVETAPPEPTNKNKAAKPQTPQSKSTAKTPAKTAKSTSTAKTTASKKPAETASTEPANTETSASTTETSGQETVSADTTGNETATAAETKGSVFDCPSNSDGFVCTRLKVAQPFADVLITISKISSPEVTLEGYQGIYPDILPIYCNKSLEPKTKITFKKYFMFFGDLKADPITCKASEGDFTIWPVSISSDSVTFYVTASVGDKDYMYKKQYYVAHIASFGEELKRLRALNSAKQ